MTRAAVGREDGRPAITLAYLWHLVRAVARRCLNVVFKFRPACAILKLRPSYFPPLVIRRYGRSAWPSDKQIRFVTSFNDNLYEVSGRRCIETFRRHNPHLELWAYVESRDPATLSAMHAELTTQGVHVVDLAELPMLSDFLEIARDVIPVVYGGAAPEEMFPPATRYDSSGYFRRNMFRWFRKMVALDHVRQGYDGVIVWMDSDCYSKARIPVAKLARAFGGAGVFYMKGTRLMSELGLIGFDCAEPGVHELLGDMKAHYMQRRFVHDRQWDDCSVFDLLRAHRQWPVCRDIGTWMELHGQHVLQSTMLAAYVEHDKGIHGRGGQRIPL